MVLDFYTIAFKKVQNAKMKYGQQRFDFNSGMMGFSSPGQVIGMERTPCQPSPDVRRAYSRSGAVL